MRSGKHILSVEVTFDFADFDERLRALTQGLSEAGEVISTLPAIPSGNMNGIAFRLLYGSILDSAAVQALAPEAAVSSLRRSSAVMPAAALPSGIFPPLDPALMQQRVPAAEEDVSLRSLSQTVRVDISRLDHVMNIVGELIIEKTQLDALTRALSSGGATRRSRGAWRRTSWGRSHATSTASSTSCRSPSSRSAWCRWGRSTRSSRERSASSRAS